MIGPVVTDGGVSPRNAASAVPVAPWLLAGLVGALVPVLLLAVDARFPGALWESAGSCRFILGVATPLSGRSLAMASWSCGLCWLIGMVGSLRADRSGHRLAGWVGSILLTEAIAAVALVAPLLSTSWTLAAVRGLVPEGAWEVVEGNHGPWYFVCDLSRFLGHALLLPVWSAGSAALALVLRPSRAAVLVLLSSGALFAGLIATHFWLID